MAKYDLFGELLITSLSPFWIGHDFPDFGRNRPFVFWWFLFQKSLASLASILISPSRIWHNFNRPNFPFRWLEPPFSVGSLSNSWWTPVYIHTHPTNICIYIYTYCMYVYHMYIYISKLLKSTHFCWFILHQGTAYLCILSIKSPEQGAWSLKPLACTLKYW